MGINAFGDISGAVEDGRVHYQYVTKVTQPAPGTAGFFVDLNQTSGHPKYNAFAGTQLAFSPMIGSGNSGVFTGSNISGRDKYLIRWQATNVNSGGQTAPPDHVILSDYLGFYPLIDCDDTTEQMMDNTQILPRYNDGIGVRIILVVQAPMVSTASLSISYTNSNGVSGRVSTFNVIPGINIGVCATGSDTSVGTAVTPFWPLIGGDIGVKSINSVTFSGSAGGFICAVLVRPLATMMILEAGVPAEEHYGFQNQMLPKIIEGAHLNFMIKRVGNAAGQLTSELIFINS